MRKTALLIGFALLLGACGGGGGGGDDSGDDAPGIDAGDDGVDANVEPAVDYYTITARANGLLVAAPTADALIADRIAAAEWEHFEVIDHGDGTIALRARSNGKFVAPGADGRLAATRDVDDASASYARVEQGDGTVALRALANEQYVSADLNEDGVLLANRATVGGAWETFTIDLVTGPPLGANTLVFDPSMPMFVMQARLNVVFDRMEDNQFGGERYAVLFAPGTYPGLDVNVGYYTEILGLGRSPDDVTIQGQVHAEADWFGGNATQNFWRSLSNFAVEPADGTMRWAVSQAAPFRRVHVRGSLVLDDNGWSSGGFLADSRIDGTVYSGSQQQWVSRNAAWGAWNGANWNMVFVGVDGAPSDAGWPNPPYTVVDASPVLREKPYLFVDGAGAWQVLVPALRTNAVGPSWGDTPDAGTVVPLADFHIARPGDSAASMNAALAGGKHLLVTPGVYHVDEPVRVTQPGAIVLGLGLATLIPDGGATALEVADVDGAIIAGLLIDANETSSEVLMRVGPTGASASHDANPISLHDVFFRVGGAAVGRADLSLEINSDDVIADHLWVWRGDHSYGVGWDINTSETGLIVNGDDVTAYGLFVEHYHRHQTVWNGNGGRVYLYQSELPYDVPSQDAWMDGGTQGYASYKVASHVTSHEAYGLGVYCFFNDNPSVRLARGIEAPNAPGIHLEHMVTVSLGGRGEITRVVNDRGPSANGGSTVARVAVFP